MPDTEQEYKNSDSENYGPSEYVRLEADFFADSYSDPASGKTNEKSTQHRTILVVSILHQSLNEIVSELQDNLGENVRVLSACDHQSVQNFLKREEIELVLYSSGPGVDAGSSILKALHADGNFTLKSTLILLRKSNPELRNWVQDPGRSKHIMKTINRLNEQV